MIPNCDPMLEIWPPGFRTYNLLVPNMFNLPNTLFGSKSFKASMGLAMYASSKAACAYCTAHTCSFALRRGARVEAITGLRTPKEDAVVRLAERLAQIPSTLTADDMEAVKPYFSAKEIEWLVFSISMMGFLNKFMNAIGVELEQDAINDTAELLVTTGWQPGIHSRSGYKTTNSALPTKDNLMTYLRVIRQAPGAVLWEKKWTGGVPGNYPSAARYLEKHTGYSFPILAPVKEPRVIRTLTTVLRDNLDKQLTVTGLRVKMYAGYIFSVMASNDRLKPEIENAAAALSPQMDGEMRNRLQAIAQTEVPTDGAAGREFIAALQQLGLTEEESAALLLAVAASYSPSQINSAVIETTMMHLKPTAVVETAVWLSVLQLLSRLSSYYSLVGSLG